MYIIDLKMYIIPNGEVSFYVHQHFSSLVKASVILLPLLGLTWVIGLFAVHENTAVFAWLFTIFNSLQVMFNIQTS